MLQGPFCYSWDWFGPTAAAWAQFIAAGIGLFIAVQAPKWHAKGVVNAATIEQINLLIAAAGELMNRIDAAVDMLEKDFNNAMYVGQFNFPEMRKMVDRLRTIDVMTLRDHRMVDFILNFPVQMNAVFDAIDVLNNGRGMDKGRVEAVLVAIKYNYQHAQKTMKDLRALLRAYGGKPKAKT